MRAWLAVALLVLGSIGAMVDVAWAAVINVASGSYYFEDATVGDGRIVVNVGDQLWVVTEDAGKGTPHTVEIAELGVSSGPLTTNSTYVTPQLNTPGTYTLFCKPHRNKGHWTTLVVVGEATTTTSTTTTTTTTSTTTTTTTTSTTTAPGVTPTSSPEESVTTTTNAPVPTTVADVAPLPRVGEAADSGEGSPGVPTTAAPSEGEVLASGVTEPSEIVWLRSVWVALLAALPLGGIAALALRGRGRS